MSGWLSRFNLVGVLALAGLCGIQWRANHAANQEVNALERARQQQDARRAELERTVAGQTADLDAFREQITRGQAALTETEGRLTTSLRSEAQLTGERDQLKSSVIQWSRAVAARDQQLQSLNAQLQSLATDRNDVVKKHNALAARHTQLAATLSQCARRLEQAAPKQTAQEQASR